MIPFDKFFETETTFCNKMKIVLLHNFFQLILEVLVHSLLNIVAYIADILKQESPEDKRCSNQDTCEGRIDIL